MSSKTRKLQFLRQMQLGEFRPSRVFSNPKFNRFKSIIFCRLKRSSQGNSVYRVSIRADF